MKIPFLLGGAYKLITCFVGGYDTNGSLAWFLLAWTDNVLVHHPQYETSVEAFSLLSNAIETNGRRIESTKLHVPWSII